MTTLSTVASFAWGISTAPFRVRGFRPFTAVLTSGRRRSSSAARLLPGALTYALTYTLTRKPARCRSAQRGPRL